MGLVQDYGRILLTGRSMEIDSGRGVTWDGTNSFSTSWAVGQEA